MLKSVFIIDDDPISNLVSETILKKVGFAEKYHTFENPKAALEKLDSLAPDLVFLDLWMPVLDGWSFLAKCKDLEKGFKIILLTATINPEDQTKAKSHPEVIDIISKPLSKEYIEELKAKFE